MVIEIGIVAGEIVDMLEKSKRPLTLWEVEIFSGRPIDLVYMALGWLIREHYVQVVKASGEKYLFLVQRESPLTRDARCVPEYLN